MRSRCRCSMCPAIHTNSRSWLRSSSTHEPSDPPLRVVFSPFRPFPEESPNWEVIPRHNVQATDERAKGSRGIERDRNPGLEKSYSTIVKEKKRGKTSVGAAGRGPVRVRDKGLSVKSGPVLSPTEWYKPSRSRPQTL